jgi:hypothetical protein
MNQDKNGEATVAQVEAVAPVGKKRVTIELNAAMADSLVAAADGHKSFNFKNTQSHVIPPKREFTPWTENLSTEKKEELSKSIKNIAKMKRHSKGTDGAVPAK